MGRRGWIFPRAAGLWCAARDRARLLHAITSNEIKKMTPGTGCYAFLLNPQGRIQADLYVFCFDDHFLLDTEPELREKVRLHIKRYIIADQVELEDVTAGTAAIGLEGPGAAAILTALGAPVPAQRLRARAVGRCDGGGGNGDGAAWRPHLLSGGKSGRHGAPTGSGGRGGGECGGRAPGAHRERQAALRRRYSRDVAAAGDAADARASASTRAATWGRRSWSGSARRAG